MAFRIGDSIIRGEIDNRVRGRVMGTIWVMGKEEPIRLDLRGNCLRDIAGHRLTFHATTESHALEDADALFAYQEGCVGDMTASRKVKTFNMPVEEFIALREQNIHVPTKMATCLYLEWFSSRNGRVVIETVDFQIDELSGPEWSMSAEEEAQQCHANLEAMTDFMHRLDESIQERDEDWDEFDDTPMDEFEWEKFLRDSDERTELYGEILEKYEGHPDAERLVAREMGWSWLDDAMDANERGVFEESGECEEEEDDYSEPELDPLREGIDWIRTEGGRVSHPLAHRAFEFQHRIWTEASDSGLVGGDEWQEDVTNMLAEARMISAKLAGALNGLAYDHDPEPGFVVAYLKRALSYFDTTMAAMAIVEQKKIMDGPVIHLFRCELFDIREGILELMKQFRAQI